MDYEGILLEIREEFPAMTNLMPFPQGKAKEGPAPRKSQTYFVAGR